MAIQTITQLKTWFRKGLKPLEGQFWDWFDSFWHKEEKIPMTSVDGLNEALNSKGSIETFQTLAQQVNQQFDELKNEMQEDLETVEDLVNFKGHANPVDYILELAVSQDFVSVTVDNYSTAETIEDFVNAINGYPYFELSQSGCLLASVEPSEGIITKVIETADGGFLRLGLNGKKVTKLTGTMRPVTADSSASVSVVSQGMVVETVLVSNDVADITFNNLSCLGDLTLTFEGELNVFSLDIYYDEEVIPEPEYDGQRIIVRSDLHGSDFVYVFQDEVWNEVYIEDGVEVIVKNEDYAGYVKQGDTFDIIGTRPKAHNADEILPARELTVDMENQTIWVHDGETPGGLFATANQAQVDEVNSLLRFCVKSTTQKMGNRRSQCLIFSLQSV